MSGVVARTAGMVRCRSFVLWWTKKKRSHFCDQNASTLVRCRSFFDEPKRSAHIFFTTRLQIATHHFGTQHNTLKADRMALKENSYPASLSNTAMSGSQENEFTLNTRLENNGGVARVLRRAKRRLLLDYVQQNQPTSLENSKNRLNEEPELVFQDTIKHDFMEMSRESSRSLNSSVSSASHE